MSARRSRVVGLLFVLLLIPVTYYGMYFLLRGPTTPDPYIIAHRGDSANAPENTLAAFAQAIEAGADWIEMDVQRTADDVLVVIHDETVDRTTDGSGRVVDLTAAQVRALDAGQGEHVPTFAEVIDLASGDGVSILPEAKSPQLYPGIEADMVETLRAGGYLHNATIQSFDPGTLEAVRQVAPEVPVCAVFGLGTLIMSDPRPPDAEAICPMAEMVILNPWTIRQAHADERDVFVWIGVSEHPIVLRALVALGADGFIVDDPLALAEVLDR